MRLSVCSGGYCVISSIPVHALACTWPPSRFTMVKGGWVQIQVIAVVVQTSTTASTRGGGCGGTTRSCPRCCRVRLATASGAFPTLRLCRSFCQGRGGYMPLAEHGTWWYSMEPPLHLEDAPSTSTACGENLHELPSTQEEASSLISHGF